MTLAALVVALLVFCLLAAVLDLVGKPGARLIFSLLASALAAWLFLLVH